MEISFKNSIKGRMLLMNAQIDNYQLTFDIDTGSTENIIFDFVYNQLENAFKQVDRNTRMFGIDGNYKENPHAETTLIIDGKNFSTEFNVVNADQTVKNLQENFGFQLHGILGVPFFLDNHCVIDFDKKTITIGENEINNTK